MKRFLDILRRDYVVLFSIVLFVLAFALVPFFSNAGNLYTLLLNTCLYGLMAIGATFTLLTGTIDFSIGFLVSFCSMIACLATAKLGFAAGIAVTLVLGILISSYNAVMINWLKVNPLILTLGTMTILRGLDTIISGATEISCTDPLLSELFTSRIFSLVPFPALLFAAALCFGVLFLRHTATGIGFYIIGGNAEAGYVNGINIPVIRLIAFALSGLFAALAGILWASRMSTGSVSIGDSLTLTIISSCVIGGVRISGGSGSLIHVLFGVLAIQIINNMMSLLALPASAQLLITGTILILVLMIERLLRPKARRKKFL